MFAKICPYCGKEFNARLQRKIYCSDACRQSAYRDRNDPQKAERYEARMQRIAEAEKLAVERAERSRREFQRKVDAGDLTAQWLDLKRRNPYSYEYWEKFAEYDKQRSETLISVVNDIRTDDPYFAHIVMASIEAEKIIRIHTEAR